MSKLLNAMKNKVNVTTTENGAKTFDKTGSKVLDFYSRGAAMRSRTDNEVLSAFKEALNENALLTLKVLFYLRDIRGGQGERKIFRTCLKWIADNREDTFINNIDNVVKFGRWDDLFVALDNPESSSAKAVFSIVKRQLSADSKSKDGTKLSLLAKWMPSSNTSSDETRALAFKFIKKFKITPKKYRRTLSSLRARLNVVEKLISANEWTSINFEHVPSKANLLYKKAFSRHQPDRYIAFIKSVQSGDAKINASTLFPYEIGREIESRESADKNVLDALWKNLPNYLEENPHNGLVVCDTSGSMTSTYGTGVKPIWVSVSLAIYFAQRNTGIFKNNFLTFNTDSRLVTIHSKNIVDAWSEVSGADWGGSTNLQSAFDKILKTAVDNNIPEEDMPKVLYVVSDMEFNSCCNGRTNFQEIERKYRAAGYNRPVICFWNVAARNNQSPVTFDQNGTILVSGCSPSIFSQVISGKNVTPYDFMLETLNKSRYESVVV